MSIVSAYCCYCLCHCTSVSWAGLELRAGNLDVCRELLREGLDQHPDFPAGLLLTAQLERKSGRLDLAEAYARRARKVCGCIRVLKGVCVRVCKGDVVVHV